MPLTHTPPPGAFDPGAVVAIYGDGGVLGANPSPVGGVWAFCLVGADGRRLYEAAGHITSDEAKSLGLQWTSNNFAEVMALLLAFETMPAAGMLRVFSDSRNAISAHQRAGDPDPWRPPYLPQPIWDRMVAARERLGPMKFTMLKGHPTKQDLARGQRPDGKPVSEHNVFCDKAATAAGRAYLASIGQLPEKPKRAAKPKADVVNRADVLDLIRTAAVPLGGFDRLDRSEFASLNMGRLQQHLIQQVQEMKGAKR